MTPDYQVRLGSLGHGNLGGNAWAAFGMFAENTEERVEESFI